MDELDKQVKDAKDALDPEKKKEDTEEDSGAVSNLQNFLDDTEDDEGEEGMDDGEEDIGDDDLDNKEDGEYRYEEPEEGGKGELEALRRFATEQGFALVNGVPVKMTVDAPPIEEIRKELPEDINSVVDDAHLIAAGKASTVIFNRKQREQQTIRENMENFAKTHEHFSHPQVQKAMADLSNGGLTDIEACYDLACYRLGLEKGRAIGKKGLRVRKSKSRKRASTLRGGQGSQGGDRFSGDDIELEKDEKSIARGLGISLKDFRKQKGVIRGRKG